MDKLKNYCKIMKILHNVILLNLLTSIRYNPELVFQFQRIDEDQKQDKLIKKTFF